MEIYLERTFGEIKNSIEMKDLFSFLLEHTYIVILLFYKRPYEYRVSLAGVGVEQKSATFNQNVDNISWVHKWLKRNLKKINKI